MNGKELLTFIEDFHGKGLSIVYKKNHDYASEGNPFSNFEFSGGVVRFFADRGADDATLGFVGLIATKLARLAELSLKEAYNESVEDTLVDLSNYVALWAAYKKARSNSS